jgi:hypothetical protein
MPLTGPHEMADFLGSAAIAGRRPASAVDTPYSTEDCQTAFVKTLSGAGRHRFHRMLVTLSREMVSQP